jgi:hypothetical protein
VNGALDVYTERVPVSQHMGTLRLRGGHCARYVVLQPFRRRNWTGLLGYGGSYGAIHEAELLLMLGTDFPFSEFLPGHSVKKVQAVGSHN